MFKSIKKSVSLIFAMICVFALSAPVVFASEITVDLDEGIISEIYKTNAFVFKAIDKAESKAEKLVNQSSLNEQKEESLDDSINDLGNKLVTKTDKEVNKLIEKAAEQGIEIERTYVEVMLHDKIFEVDPMYVH